MPNGWQRYRHMSCTTKTCTAISKTTPTSLWSSTTPPRHTPKTLSCCSSRSSTFTAFIPEGFGTGDVVIIADHTLDFTDLKYGKGVPVSAQENKQMMLYALGALHEFGYMYDIRKVRMTIYQPRLDSISTYELTVEELMDWAHNELKPKAQLAFAGEGEYAPGDACRFCRAKVVCRAHADYNLQLAKYDFMDPQLLSDNEIADILTRADNFTKWLSAVSEHALAEAVNNGKRWWDISS